MNTIERDGRQYQQIADGDIDPAGVAEGGHDVDRRLRGTQPVSPAAWR